MSERFKQIIDNFQEIINERTNKIEMIINNIKESELKQKTVFTHQTINNKLITIQVINNENQLNLYINDKEEDTLTSVTRLMFVALSEKPETEINVFLITNK